MTSRGDGFGGFVAMAHASGRLVVQPRMGFSDPRKMRRGLVATKRAGATTVGTITLDSYTRVGDDEAARSALTAGMDLNGYPIVAHDLATTSAVLDGVSGPDFPVQVRHGSSLPQGIIRALVRAGLSATEGGPVSYCLPYGRTPLATSVENWARSCDLLSDARDNGIEPHLETFGGCMMGQLCPPSLLIAISVLEAMFFVQHGLRSVSLSYAQQTNTGQDEEAVFALRRLAAELLPGIDWHVVLYTYMGVYPRTRGGATRLLREAAVLAARTGAARLIVKTVAEAFRIPTIEENISALESAAAAATGASTVHLRQIGDTGVHAEARAMIDLVLSLDVDIGRALIKAFRQGCLDVPYCLHPDNAGRTRSTIDEDGWLRWAAIGGLPIGRIAECRPVEEMTAIGLLSSLSYVERKFDRDARHSGEFGHDRGAITKRAGAQ